MAADSDQLFLMPQDMRDWLPEDHLVWFMIDVVASIDTSRFHARHPNNGVGRPAYDPDMMLALLFYTYAMGLRSSRRIESACRTDAAYRVICGDLCPDHTTIARFVVDHEAAIAEAFVDVLRLCAATGLVSVGAIAIDGTKMGTDAALDANRKRDWIQTEVSKILAEVAAADTADDSQNDLFDTDKAPAAMSRRPERLARLQQALGRIDAEDAADRAAAEESAASARQAAVDGRKLDGRKPKEPHAALARAEADAAAVGTRIEQAHAERVARRADLQAEAAAAGTTMGRGPTAGLLVSEQRQLEEIQQQLTRARTAVADATAAANQQREANITDPDSRIMKTAGGWIQGYNAQAAVNENQIVVACAVTQQGNDIGQYQPMVTAAQHTLTAAGIDEPINLVLADAGYWSESNATTAGPDRLIATLKDHKQRRAARDLGTTTGPPPDGASTAEAMEHRLRTPDGAAQYATRSHTVEPVFGHHKHNRGYRHFRRRGLTAASSEWALINTAHNLKKLFDHPD